MGVTTELALSPGSKSGSTGEENLLVRRNMMVEGVKVGMMVELAPIYKSAYPPCLSGQLKVVGILPRQAVVKCSCDPKNHSCYRTRRPIPFDLLVNPTTVRE